MDLFCYLCFVFFMLVFVMFLLSVHRSLIVTCWERANLLALLYVIFSSVFVTFPCGVLGRVYVVLDCINS